MDTAKEHIEGNIDIYEVKNRIEQYYEVLDERKDIENGNYPNIINAITSSSKILPEMDKRLATFKTLSKMPAKLEFACFSMEYMYGDTQETYNPTLLKELNEFYLEWKSVIDDENQKINSNGIKYPNYKLNIKEAVISNYGEIENKGKSTIADENGNFYTTHEYWQGKKCNPPKVIKGNIWSD